MNAKPASRAGGFSPFVMLALILVSVFAFAAYFTLGAFAPELTSGRDGRAHALSQSAVGFAAAVRISRARGDSVSIGRTIANTARYRGLVIVTPEHQMGWTELEEITGRSTLIILPKWIVGPHPLHRGWVSRFDQAPGDMVASLLEKIAPETKIEQLKGSAAPHLIDENGVEYDAAPIEHLQTISGPNIQQVVADSDGHTVLGYFEGADEQPIYILSDPDFLNTYGLRELANVRAGFAMLDIAREHPDFPIIFDVTANGLGAARSPLRMAFEPPFLGATLGLVVAAMLLAWRAAARFGPSAPSRRAIPLGKAALADNSAALIRLAGREAQMGPSYARVTAMALAEELSGQRKEESDAIVWLDALARAHNVEPPFSALRAEAVVAKTRTQMLEAARKLHAWKLEIKRATR